MLPIIPIAAGAISIFSNFVSSAVGWAWDKVVQGIFTWFAEGLLLLIEWVWGLLDTATTPRLSDHWFVNGTVAALLPIALFVTVAMMLVAAIQAALSGRPELIPDAVTAAVRAIAGTMFTLVVMDTLIQFADVIADTVWVQARPNTRDVLDGITKGVLGGKGWGATFLGPLALLIGMVGMLVTALLLFMRSAMLYFVAAFAPLMWSTSVVPMFRGGIRRTVQIVVGLVLAKPAIVITLAIGMQLIAASPLAGQKSDSNVAQLGTMLTGFFCFAAAAFSPWVVYKLLPAVEGGATATGIAGGWARSAMTVTQGVMMAKTLGASRAAAAATKAIPTGERSSGSTGFTPPPSGGGGPLDAGGGGGGGGGGGTTSTAPGGSADTAGSAASTTAASTTAAPAAGVTVAAAASAKQAATTVTNAATSGVPATSSSSAAGGPSGSGSGRQPAASLPSPRREPRRIVITPPRPGAGDDEEGDGG
jgi:hypothetical protein